MADRHTFGFELRRERERAGLTLEQIAARTKVGIHVWAAMERSDFSGWPTGLFARSHIREYAILVGLDPEETVNEFCRLFPIGDRRAGRLIRGQAEIVGHTSVYRDEPPPAAGERRQPHGPAADRQGVGAILATPAGYRSVTAAIDAGVLIAAGAAAAWMTGGGFWGAFGVASVMYYSGSFILFATTPGRFVAEQFRHRLSPPLTVTDPRAHA